MYQMHEKSLTVYVSFERGLIRHQSSYKFLKEEN